MARSVLGAGARVGATGAAMWGAASPWARRLVVAAAAAFLLTGALGWYLPEQIEHRLWASELDADRATLRGLLSHGTVPPRTTADLEAIDRFVRDSVLVGDYVRTKLWKPDGTIVYSDDPALVGRRFPVEGGLRGALAGRDSNEVSKLDRQENQGERALADRVLEVYVPVVRDGEVVAVWEVYRSLDRFDDAMTGVRRAVWVSVGGALALLLVLLVGLVGTLLEALGRRTADATELSRRLGALLAIANETSRSLDSGELARAAVLVIREEGEFDGVALVRGSAPPEVVAMSTTAACAGDCLLDGHMGSATHDGGCRTLGVPLPGVSDELVLVACRRAPAPFTPADEVVVRASCESLGMAWANARLYEELSASQDTQRRLTRELVDTHETERRAIVGEIHDGLGQTLHRVLFGLRRVRGGATDGGRELAKLEGLVENCITDLRAILRRLSPPVLEDLGLVPALRSLAATVDDDGEMAVDLQTTDVPELPLPARVAVYRIVQEALHNASKHGHAGHAVVDVAARNGSLVARVEDDGSGYQPAASNGLGVWLMRERAEALGGSFEIQRTATGTAVEARIPVGAGP